MIRHYLGWAYFEGTIVAADAGRALPWFERAARDGLANAQYRMGQQFEKGEGAQASAIEAYHWYGLAALQDHSAAKRAFERLGANLAPEQIEAAKSRIAAFKSP